jgi:hypothetical protein
MALTPIYNECDSSNLVGLAILCSLFHAWISLGALAVLLLVRAKSMLCIRTLPTFLMR